MPFLVHFPGKIKPNTVIDEALTSVDLLPTVLPMMGHKTVGREEGRDASELFATGKAPNDWKDVAFVRGTGTNFGWLSVITDRYKLVYSPVDPPWLFDLERDPDEVTNFFEHAGYREAVQQLATLLRAYATKNNDNFAELPRIKADIEWSISGTGKYENPRVTTGNVKKKRKRKAE